MVRRNQQNLQARQNYVNIQDDIETAPGQGPLHSDTDFDF